MKKITFDNFCEMLNTTRKDAIEQRRKYQDFDYAGPHITSKLDHHLVFAAISISLMFNIKSIYEIGTCAGNCCRVLTLMWPEARIRTLDLPTNADNDNAVRLLTPFKNVKMEYYNSAFLWECETRRYDCVFVDGCHKYPVVFSDMMWAYVNTNQIIVFHDVSEKAEPDVVESLEYLDSIIHEEVFRIDSESSDADIGIVIKGFSKNGS